MKTSLPTIHRIGLILLLLILLPALFYSVYEVSALSTTEELIGRAYRQQLDAILFSVNQYAWDVASVWASRTTALFESARTPQSAASDTFFSTAPGVVAVFSSNTASRGVSLLHSPSAPATGRSITNELLTTVLDDERGKLDRMVQLSRRDYRRIEPLVLPLPDAVDTLMVLAFAGGTPLLVNGMIIEPRVFAREIIGQKLRDAAGDDFVLAVLETGESGPVYITTPEEQGRFEQHKSLWLLPNLSLGIRLKGESIESLAQAIYHRNLLLIILLNIVLIGGAWLVYRTMRREMELVRLKSDFVSNVSHELRTPLSLIRMFAETLEMNRVPTEQKKREYYATIVQEADRLTRLVNNILNFSRIEAGRKEYHFQQTHLGAIAGKVAGTYNQHLRDNGFVFTEKIETDLPPVNADTEAVTEALINIMDNAVKYSGDEKWIELRTERADGAVILAVEDHGFGIAHADQKKIFEKFYRASSALVHNTKGSGLGLTLVQHIMHAHGGSVDVVSTPGKGSTFRLVFPAPSNG